MLEVLLLLCIAGAGIAARKNLGLVNPYSIYFSAWGFIILVLVLQKDSFYPVSLEVGMLMLAAKSLVIVQLACISTRRRGTDHLQLVSLAASVRPRALRAAQLAVLFAAPFAYMRARELAAGEDIFSVLGYIALRASMTSDGQSFGITSYFAILSYVVTSLILVEFAAARARMLTAVFSVAISVLYAYLGTARTGVLLFAACGIVPLIVVGAIRQRGLTITLFVVVGLFSAVALMTGKGLSSDASIAENFVTYSANLRAYTASPLVAFSQFVATTSGAEFGVNTFRFVLSLFYSLGLADNPPVVLIREYAFVPDATNVYTVYEAYFRDFSYLGVFLPPAFLLGHWWLYRRSQRVGGRWTFYYAVSVYPLLMQFFQDQYFSLVSMWIQLAFWYGVLVSPSTNAIRGGPRHA